MATVVTVVGMASCAPEAPAEFRIGLLALSDPGCVESSGEPSIRDAELAALEINRAGGLVVDERQYVVRIVVGGYPTRTDAATTAARALLNHDSVHALIGPQVSDHAIPVAVIAEAAQVPMISPMTSNAETTDGKQYVSRLAFLDEAHGGALARFAMDSLGATRAALLYDESTAYSRSVSERFRRGFEEAGGEVVASETYTSDQSQTFVDQLRRIRRARPDVLLLPNVTREDSDHRFCPDALGARAESVSARVDRRQLDRLDCRDRSGRPGPHRQSSVSGAVSARA